MESAANRGDTDPPAPPVPTGSRRPLLRLLGFALAAALIILLYRSVPLDFAEMGRRLRNARLDWLAVALGAYFLCYVARAIRFRLLLYTRRPRIRDLTAVAAIHNLMNMALPARTGELSWIWLSHRRFGVALGETTAALLLSRLYDVIGLVLCFVTALLLRAPSDGADRSALFVRAALVLAGAIVVLVGTVPLLWHGARLVERLLASIGLSRHRGVVRGLELVHRLVGHIEAIRARRTALPALVVTQLQWILTFVTCHALVRAYGLEFSFAGSVLGATGLSIALLLPVNAFLNLGTFEAGWVSGFVLAGLPREPALASALFAHLVLTLAALLFAGIAALLPYPTPQDGAERSEAGAA